MIREISRAFDAAAATGKNELLSERGSELLQNLEQKTWVLETGTTAYCIGLSENRSSTFQESSVSQLVHLYWGPALPCVDDYLQSIAFPERSSFDDGSLVWGHEYRPWYGRMYQEPTLKVLFPDGTRDIAWHFEHAEVLSESGERDLLVLHFLDHKGLHISLYYQTVYDQDILVRWVEVTNISQDVIQITQLSAAVWNLPPLETYQVTTVYGDWGREFQLQRHILSRGKFVVESRKGHTSHQANPFFMLDSGASNEELGDVWFGGIAWSGNWKIAFERNSHNQLSVSGGYNDFDFVRVLKAGEKVASPYFFGGYTGFGFGGASRLLHRFAHRIQERHGTKERPTPVLYNSWEATYFDVNERDQMKLAEIAASVGVELFVVDDGWFGKRNSDHAGLGDWLVNQEKFPNGLDPLIQHVEQLGMRFGIWVEPEMVNPDSDLYRAHPDWVLHFPQRGRTLARNQAVLDYANPKVREYIFEQLDDLLTRYSITFVKWDMNRPLTEPGSTTLSPAMQPEVWMRHVEGLYEILGKLHERHPDVVFESCSGGGGRVDLAMLRFTSQFWTSDNTDAYDRLRIQEGFSYAYPASTMRAWVTDSPQFMNDRRVPLVFRFHSAMMGALGIGSNILEWTEEERTKASQRIEVYKSIRHVVTDGDLYRLVSPTFGTPSGETGAWTAVEYVAADGSEAVVFVLGRGTQYGDSTPVIRPRGLLTQETYELELVDFHTSDQQRFMQGLNTSARSGLAWSRMGFRLGLRGDYASAIVRFRRTNAQP